MQPFRNLLIGVTVFMSLAVEADQLTIERIYSSPSLSGQSIQGLKLSPDGKRVSFLQGKAENHLRMDLWQLDLESGKTSLLVDADQLEVAATELSDEEKARRERLRIASSGIIEYQWSKDAKALLFPLAGDVFYYSLETGRAKRLINTRAFETDVRFSPKGRYVSYIREQNLYVYDLHSAKEIQLTSEGGGLIKMGMAEFVAQEEMDRMTGYWWSPDETKIAITRVDESPVEVVIRSEIYADHIKMVEQRYPFAGKANAKVDLGVLDIKTKKIRWLNASEDKDYYLARVNWMPDSRYLTYQWQSRDQKRLKLIKVDIPSLKKQTLIDEQSETWINLHNDLRFLKDSPRFVWASEKDGYKHLYLYDNQGKFIRQLTRGEWVVDQLHAIDEGNEWVYFSGRKDTPLERHLYRVSLKGGKIEKISQRPGMHRFIFSANASYYIDRFSSIKTPPQISLHNADGKQLRWLNENKIDDAHPLKPYMDDWITPTLGSFISDQGVKLYYRLYKPAGFDASKKYPVLVYLYGGPHAQMVTNSWGNYFLQYMAQQGYVVFTLDNRGSNYRGKVFEDAIYRAMGSVEVDDQVAGVKFLRQLPWVDAKRIGVYGHSYGGYMSLLCMFKAGEYFSAGVAGAPVTDWRLYDTHYTERYMGDPEKDRAAYDASSVFPYALNLKGNLLIYHGMADDNVLFKNSTRLYKLLQDNNIYFEMMDYPGKKHSIRGQKTRMHRANMIKRFFDRTLGQS